MRVRARPSLFNHTGVGKNYLCTPANMAMLMMLSQQYKPLMVKHSLQIGQKLPRMEIKDAVTDHAFVSMQDESTLEHGP